MAQLAHLLLLLLQKIAFFIHDLPQSDLGADFNKFFRCFDEYGGKLAS